MSYYSLPLNRQNVKVPEENCYLVIQKYGDDYLITKDGKKIDKKNKLTAQELKDKKDCLVKQEATIRQLETGYCNLYNNKFKLDTIFDSWFTGYLDGNKDVLVYKIKPLASNEVHNNNYYSLPKQFEVSEFNAVKLNTKEEIIDQIYKDKLLKEFSAIIFDNFSYGNEGYNLKLYSYFEYIKETYPDFKVSLSDIVLNPNDYKHPVRNHFGKRDTYDVTRINVRYLLDNNLIEYFKEGDYYITELIIGLLDSALYDVAYDCIKLLNEYNKQNLIKSKDFDVILRKWSTNEYVKEIVNYLGITLSGVTLTVKGEAEWDECSILETKIFNNIAEVKTYLIKEYDIPFEKVVNADITDFYYDEMKFNVN
jgi:hypothetical protein